MGVETTHSKDVDHDVSTTSGQETETTTSLTTKSKKDEHLVRFARVTIVAVLFVSAATVSLLANVLLSKTEVSSFEAQFESAAKQVILMANLNAVNVFTSFGTMAAMYPSAAELANTSMPFVTLQGFDMLALGIRNEWIQEGRRNMDYGNLTVSDDFLPFVLMFGDNSSIVPKTGQGPFAPNWQISPVPANVQLINVDAWSYNTSRSSMEYVINTKKASLSAPEPAVRMFYNIEAQGPISLLHQPVFDIVPDVPEKEVVGILTGFLAWQSFFQNVLPEGYRDVVVVVDSCGTNSTFRINGPEAAYVGEGDFHETKFNHMGKTQYFVGSEVSSLDSTKRQMQCTHLVHVFPTPELEAQYITDTPMHYAIVIVGIFTFAAVVFMLYDYFVTSRQNRTEQQASQSNAIVQEMFPGGVANQLFHQDNTADANRTLSKMNTLGKVDRTTIAELHPEATVMFADISGFTAWSSIRDPHQVFNLLESIFQAFDGIAKKYRVFKVETIGDCYVAACGVPVVNSEHAVVMCRFARSIMTKFRWVCRSLELTLGPDTGDLALRVGMHSGPVTAGVLRGDRARFQLFGDTVNTASRLESTGKRERVHISEQTAQQLIARGKDDWLVRREDAVEAKGKGKLTTFWLKLAAHEKSTESVADGTEVADHDYLGTCPNETSGWNVEMPTSKTNEADQRNERLAHWNSDLLLELLHRVVAHRAVLQASDVPSVALSSKTLATMAKTIGNGATVVEEVVEIIDMPDYVCTSSVVEGELSKSVVHQLREFVQTIASMYNNNPFHNFEHASHVTMSVNKLLTRIVAPKIDLSACSDADQQAAFLHDHTCGITSDPLTQFAVVLSALIHDLDHPGVSNGQLIKEDSKMAERYKEKSVAEQNSVDLAWSVLMAPAYERLRMAIFSTEAELRHFRNLLVNSIIATDIFDKDQGTIRKNRWNKAFFETTPDDEAHAVKSRKATIVIEHLIQASDVAHTMQHWHVYQKWNQRLFDEMMMAYRAGRSDKDPSLGWYSGELWFFDNYVIPLTKKLKECGVFGVSCDEYLNYALHNRDEWEAKGEEVVQQYLEEFERQSRFQASVSRVSRVQL